MKKILGLAIITSLLTACSGTGDRTVDMETNATEKPTENINNGDNVYDSSAFGVQDSSTTIAHDTGVVRKN